MPSDFELGSNEQLTPRRSASALLGFIPRKVRIVLCIMLGSACIIAALIIFKPEANKIEIPETVVRVDTIEAVRSSYPIVVSANGTIEAETRGNLVAQVSGEIVDVSNNFTTGGTFSKGDVLIQIDKRDYQANLSQSSASLSQAESGYSQEVASAKQAEDDWHRLGNTGTAPDLVMRKPQLAAAKAQLDSAKASYQTAKLNLSRTTITAPYDGRVIRRQTVLGQYVTLGTPIAEVFSTDRVEVRLPISQREFQQLGLNEFSVNGTLAKGSKEQQFKVLITSTIGLRDYNWHANIVRTDSTYDLNTRQIDVIAEVQDPFSKELDQPPLKIGQFVSARIQGRTVDDVYVIPNKSVREGLYVYAVRDERLAKLPVQISWQDDENSIIASGLNDNEVIVTTSLNSTLTGARAKLTDDAENLSAEASLESNLLDGSEQNAPSVE